VRVPRPLSRQGTRISFGRHFISRPDLPERLGRKLPLACYDCSAFHGGDGRGFHRLSDARRHGACGALTDAVGAPEDGAPTASVAYHALPLRIVKSISCMIMPERSCIQLRAA
jgi:hypothetical protein